MRKIAPLLAAALVAVGIYAAVHYRQQPSHQGHASQTFIDLNGSRIDLSDYRGKILLVNFWAAWCVPCREEIPQFVMLQDKYRDQGVQVIGISIDDTESELRDFYRKYKMNYPVIPGDQKSADAFGGVPGLPTTFVIDRESKIRARQVGSTNFQALQQQIAPLLNSR